MVEPKQTQFLPTPDKVGDEAGLGTDRHRYCWGRYAFFGLGWACVALGMIGVFVPGMPTTVFLIVALWAFSRSSERFQLWLWNHPRFGPSLRQWHEHRVIPVRAKIAAVTTMTLSLVITSLWLADGWQLPGLMAVIMIPVAAYIVTRRSRPPLDPAAIKEG
ncbi:MAG: YbaN family protein [Rhodospirillales bacterium]